MGPVADRALEEQVGDTPIVQYKGTSKVPMKYATLPHRNWIVSSSMLQMVHINST